MKPRVAIIGCGVPGKGQARGHVWGYLHANCEVVALCDIVQDNAIALRDVFGLAEARLYTDYTEMLASEPFDIVSICLWPHLHAPAVLAAARAGVRAVHCEKPMAGRLDEARLMLAECERLGVRLTFNHQRRFLSQFQEAQRLLRDGAIGELQCMEAHCLDLFDWGTHWFDLMLGFNEQNPVDWVFAGVDCRQPHTIFGLPIERFGMANFACQNGVRGTLVGGRGDDVWDGSRIRLSGSQGIIEIGQTRKGIASELRLLGSGNGWETLPFPAEDEAKPFPRVMKDLVRTLESGEPSVLCARNALQATELIFAAYESARLRERVALPLENVEGNPFLCLLQSLDAVPNGTRIY